MDQFSFHGPFVYRWINDVPVERIDLRSGERNPIEMGCGGRPPTPPASSVDHPATPIPMGADAVKEGSMEDTEWRAAMAPWN